MTYIGIYLLLIILRAVGTPVLKEIPWPWFFLWPLVLFVVMLVIRILYFLGSFVLVFGFLALLAWLWFWTKS
jgi:CBS domain containing-hemolysin-like protein